MWCLESDSNRYAAFAARDFKSRVTTYSTTEAFNHLCSGPGVAPAMPYVSHTRIRLFHVALLCCPFDRESLLTGRRPTKACLLFYAAASKMAPQLLRGWGYGQLTYGSVCALNPNQLRRQPAGLSVLDYSTPFGNLEYLFVT